MCLLERALYGHPESGAHWEQHLTKIIKEMDGVAISDHPSCFWFPKTKLMCTVYVDDLLLSGPASEHERFWKELSKAVNIEDSAPLERFLGRSHNVVS